MVNGGLKMVTDPEKAFVGVVVGGGGLQPLFKVLLL